MRFTRAIIVGTGEVVERRFDHDNDSPGGHAARDFLSENLRRRRRNSREGRVRLGGYHSWRCQRVGEQRRNHYADQSFG